MEENDGNIGLIDKTLREHVPASHKADFDRAAKSALDALKDFNLHLKTVLAGRTADCRLGKEKYEQKFRFTLVSGKTPEQVRAEADAPLKSRREERVKLAPPRPVE